MIYWFLFIALEIYRNYFLITKRSVSPDYGDSLIFRAFFALIFIFIIYPDFAPFWQDTRTMLWEVAPVVAYLVTSFYTLFDPILHKLLKKPNPLTYRGKKSGILDPLFLKLGTGYYILFKVFTLIILIISIYALLRGDQYRIL